MNKNLLTVALFFTTLNLVAQKGYKNLNDNYVLDSLKAVLKNVPDDSSACVVSFKIAREYLKKDDAVNFKKYYQKANSLTKKNQFLKDLSTYNYSGFYYLEGDFENYIKQLLIAEKRLRKYEINEVYKIRAGILFNKSVQNRTLNSKESMKILIYETLPLAKKANDFEMCTMIYKSIGVLLYNEKEYQKAALYLKKAIDTYEKNKLKNYELLTSSYLLYAEILIWLKKFNEANRNIIKAQNILNPYPESEYHILFNFTLGLYHHNTKSHQQALFFFEKAIKKAGAVGDYFMVNRTNLMKVLTLKEMKRYEEAKKILLSLYNNEEVYQEDKISYLKELAFIYKKTNELSKSIEAYEKYIISSDSLKELKYKEELQKLENAFNNLETKEKLSKLDFEKKSALQIAKNNHLKYAIFLLISIILILLLITFWVKSRKQIKINIAKEIALNHKINALKSEKELISLYAMMEGEENERKRIARDLHDGLGGSLSSIKMRVEKIAQSNSDKEELSKIHNLIDNSVKELRQVAYNLIPETLLKLGLNQALDDLCLNYSSDDLLIEYHSSQINEKIIKPHQITIYRIIQELIHNIIKHSEATEAIVDCSQNGNLFLITTEDNGKGFDLSSLKNSKGIGLRSIENRVELLNGKLDIDTNPSEGTTINIELFISMNL